MDYISKQKNKIMNNRYYLINSTLYYIHQLGFHYSLNDENYILLFPIFKIKGRPTLFCKLVYNIVDNIIIFVIIRPNNELNSTYYNQTYGNAKDYNKKVKNNDPLAHAEILCIKKATKKLKTNNLNDCELYSLLIPCKMCREVIKEVRIKKVHYILDNDKKINDNTIFYKIDVDSSLNKELSNKITSFFRKKR